MKKLHREFPEEWHLLYITTVNSYVDLQYSKVKLCVIIMLYHAIYHHNKR